MHLDNCRLLNLFKSSRVKPWMINPLTLCLHLLPILKPFMILITGLHNGISKINSCKKESVGLHATKTKPSENIKFPIVLTSFWTIKFQRILKGKTLEFLQNARGVKSAICATMSIQHVIDGSLALHSLYFCAVYMYHYRNGRSPKSSAHLNAFSGYVNSYNH